MFQYLKKTKFDAAQCFLSLKFKIKGDDQIIIDGLNNEVCREFNIRRIDEYIDKLQRATLFYTSANRK